MSYSFSIRVATKEQAKQAVVEKFEEIAKIQTCHQKDKDLAVGVTHTFIDMLEDDETKEVVVVASGALMGQWDGTDVTRVTSANMSVSAYLLGQQA